MQKRLTLALLLLSTASACRRPGAVRVVVQFEGFEPGCLEIAATDTKTGESDSLRLEGEKLKNGKAVIGIGPEKNWSQRLELHVRSFEQGCEGPALEERSKQLTVEPAVVSEWLVTLTAADDDGDGFAAKTAEVQGTDCDDVLAARHPGATETCGPVDMNCDARAGCLDPLCVAAVCDDGAAGTTLDACLGDGGCVGRPFTNCAPGTFVTGAGSPTADRTCSPCPSASFSTATNATNCAMWNDCVPGQYVAAPPSTTVDRICAACAGGYYSVAPNSSGCAPAGMCAPGTAETVPATSTNPVQCVACVAGTYCAGGSSGSIACSAGLWDDDGNPASLCTAWTPCPPGTVQTAPGSTTANPTCAPCPAGNFCPGDTAPATSCAAGTWDDDGLSTTDCVAWAQCAPGSLVTAQGSATSNRTCAACAVGSFSPSVNAPSCTNWTTCVAGQYVGTAGSTTVDLLCSACVGGFSTTTNAVSCTAWSSCSLDTYEFAAPSVTVDRVCRNYTSCLDRLTHVPATVTGSYVIDADGPGGTAPFTVTCDMTTAPGGWTVISFEDFTTSSLGWSDGRRDTTSSCFTAQGAMLGGYNVFGSTATSSKTYTLFGVTHTQVRVALDYFVIDTWDNEFGRVSVDGTQVFNGQFNQGGPNVCGGATGDRWSQPVLATQPHTTNTMTLNVTSTLDQAANDESFGVDNVSMMIR